LVSFAVKKRIIRQKDVRHGLTLIDTVIKRYKKYSRAKTKGKIIADGYATSYTDFHSAAKGRNQKMLDTDLH
jgi:hypothetical protein